MQLISSNTGGRGGGGATALSSLGPSYQLASESPSPQQFNAPTAYGSSYAPYSTPPHSQFQPRAHQQNVAGIGGGSIGFGSTYPPPQPPQQPASASAAASLQPAPAAAAQSQQQQVAASPFANPFQPFLQHSYQVPDLLKWNAYRGTLSLFRSF